MMLRCAAENAQRLRTKVDSVIRVRVKVGFGSEEHLRRLVCSHGLGRPVVYRDDGFFFGDETAADVHAREAPEERLFFFAGEAVDFSGLDEVCTAVEVAAPFFGIALVLVNLGLSQAYS